MPALPAFPLTRRPSDAIRRGRLVLSLVVLVAVAVSAAAALAYLSFPSAGRTSPPAAFSAVRAEADCCRGMEGLELWGPAVKWGSDYRLPSATARCAACKAMLLHPEDGATATEQEIASHYNLLQLLGQSVSKKSYVEAAVPELQALPVAPDLDVQVS